MSDLTFDQLYEDLVTAAKTRPPAQSFSAAQYADDSGLTHKQSLSRLKDWRDEGRIEGDQYTVDGHRQWMFWFTEVEVESE